MRATAFAALAAVMTCPLAAIAQERAVVVELFTSQGCSSCPPADAMLHEMTQMEGVIPLALHVDYWDYIGWQDTFGSPQFTERQHAYAVAAGQRTVYTPQFIIGGRDVVIGADAMEVMDRARDHARMESPVALQIARDGDSLHIAAPAVPGLGEVLTVQLVRFRPSASVDITRGENAGHRLDYANIVTAWLVIGHWDGRAALDLQADLTGTDPAVVILQEAGPGLIVAAEVLR